MKLHENDSDEALLRELGLRLSRLRVARDWTQAELARRAAVGVRTVQRIESGAVAAQLSAFLRVCRALELLPRIDALLPDATPEPMAALRRGKGEKRRASGRPPRAAERDPKWTWREPT